MLQGSNDPALATSKIRLADLTHMARSTTTMRDTGNFIIPPTSGTSYIAFKYCGFDDWFNAGIDNIHISGNPTTEISKLNSDETNVGIYPNPASNELHISFTNKFTEEATVKLINTSGKIVLTQKVMPGTQLAKLDISRVAKGTYSVQVVSNNSNHTQQLIIH